MVCDTLKTPCLPAPRAHMFSTCARGAGIYGDVLNVYQVEGEGERVGGSSTASCFSSVKQVIFFGKFHEHLNRTLGSSLIDNLLLTMITCFRGSPKETLGSYQFHV